MQVQISSTSAAAPASIDLPTAASYNLKKRFKPDALLSAQGLSHGIPKIIHQSWKNEDVPEHYHAWISTWKQNHPDWVYKLWTDDENRELVARHYPWFLQDYDSFQKARRLHSVLPDVQLLKWWLSRWLTSCWGSSSCRLRSGGLALLPSLMHVKQSMNGSDGLCIASISDVSSRMQA